MKKTLVAIAALAAVSSFAQSSVTLYGIMDIYVGSAKGAYSYQGNPATPGAQTNQATGQQSQLVLNGIGLSGSRWGMRGSEDLGGGLKANFVAESGFNPDTGTVQGALFGRQAYVGLSGGFGEIRGGRQYTAYDELRCATDNVCHTSGSATQASGAWARVGSGYSARADNQIYYATPNFGGLSGAIGYALGENKTSTTSAGKTVSIHAKYANGPILVGIAHQNERATGAANNALKNTLISGSYDLGVAKLFTGYNTTNNQNTSSKDTEFQFGVAVPFGAAKLSAAFGTAKEKSFGGAAFEKGTTLALQGEYALSKRTDLNLSPKCGHQRMLLLGCTPSTFDHSGSASLHSFWSTSFPCRASHACSNATGV